MAKQKPKLEQETAQRLKELIRMGHPSEKDEPYSRFDVIHEIERRGWKQMLIDLDIPVDLNLIWKNRYTGCEQTLQEILTMEGYHELKANSQIPFALENWEPKETWEDSEMFEDYKKKLYPDKYDKGSLLFYK